MNVEDEVLQIVERIEQYRCQGIERHDMRLTVTRQFLTSLCVFLIAEFGSGRIEGCSRNTFLGVPIAIQQDLIFPYWRLGFVLQARQWV